MTITPIEEDPEKSRPYFARMRQLFLDMEGKKYDNVSMRYLSMGMSGILPAPLRRGPIWSAWEPQFFGQRKY
jgi:uncharacterized pyridoxal phosphate-containing UPF0001 family protein